VGDYAVESLIKNKGSEPVGGVSVGCSFFALVQ